MSHFTVLVIGPDPAAQLQPFHEFECTGTDDQYVQDVDITEEFLKEYQNETITVYSVDGQDVDDASCYRDPTLEETAKHGPFFGTGCGGGISWSSRDWGDGRGYRGKIFDPDHIGATKRKVPVCERMSRAEYLEYSRGDQALYGPSETPDTKGDAKYGYARTDETGEIVQVIDRTNPDAKWDGWTIGGRWRGFFPLKKRPGSLPSAETRKADQVRAGSVDFEGARKAAEREARRRFALWAGLVQEYGQAPTWEETRNAHDSIDAAREEHHAHPLIRAAKDLDFLSWGCPVTEMGYDRAAYVRKCVNAKLVPYAVLIDGKWCAKGEMGWFGMSDDDMTQEEWNCKVHEMYDSLPPETLLTLVDCHI